MRRPTRKLWVALSNGCVVALAPPHARAVPYAWTGVAGDGLWSTAANWSPNGVPGAADVELIPAGAGVNLAGNTANFLTNRGTLTFGANILNLLQGTINNTGVIQGDASSHTGSYLGSTTNNATLIGGGEVLLQSAQLNNSGGTLINQDNLIHGYGTIFGVVNNATIVADVSANMLQL